MELLGLKLGSPVRVIAVPVLLKCKRCPFVKNPPTSMID
jgi:hypothetical protein